MKDILQPVVRKFLPYAKERMGFDDAPSIYLRTDPKNSESIFGKTAHYDPNERSIVLYIHNRHPKDVLRSLSHELVHHAQNCRGEFDGKSEHLEQGYAQKNPHLRDMEEEAYSVGNLVFRDFEDMMKEKTIYREFLEKGETLEMSHEKWRNKELGTLLSESWGFGFDLSRLSEAQEAEQDPDPESEEAEKDDKGQPEEQKVDDISDELKEGMCSGKRDKENKCPGCPKCKPMEEGEKPDFPDVDGDGDREEPISKASKEKKEKDGDEKKDEKEEKSDKDMSKVPPQLRKHVKSKMDERNYLDTMAGADMQLTDKQKEQLGYLLAKRGEKLSSDPVKRHRQINYYIKMLDNRAKEKLDQTPDYMDKDDDKPAIRMMQETKLRAYIRKLIQESLKEG